jgi:lipoate-protein ligase B
VPQPDAVLLLDLGRTRYGEALQLMRDLHARRKAGVVGDLLLVTEHEPVITTGRGADFRNLLVPAERLAVLGIELARVERGGDITYHGPGQLVAYPILDLHGFGRDVHLFARRLEEAARTMLRRYGVEAERRAGAPGLYVGESKVASIGIFVSRWVTMHGIAINLDIDPAHAALLIPCGLAGVALTSVARLVGAAPAYAEAVTAFAAAFADSFGCRVVSADPTAVV